MLETELSNSPRIWWKRMVIRHRKGASQWFLSSSISPKHENQESEEHFKV